MLELISFNLNLFRQYRLKCTKQSIGLDLTLRRNVKTESGSEEREKVEDLKP